MQTRTRLSLVIHYKELFHTTNTGLLAQHSIINSDLTVRGLIEKACDLRPLLDEIYLPILLFPSDDAVDLSDFLAKNISTRPIRLIVPDGTWRQAYKVHSRHPEIAHIPRVKISPPNIHQHLRVQPRKDGTATLAAIAEAMGLLEGSEVRDQLMALFEAKRKATLLGRSHSTSWQ